MRRHHKLYPASVLWALIGFLTISACVIAADSVRDSQDFRAQLLTVSNIRHICNAITAYRSEEGKPPENLEALINNKDYFLDAEKARERLQDGWGRALVYYTNGNTFMLISLGKNGVLDPQSSCGGCPTSAFDYDADIVWIGDHWAQSPKDVDQF